MKQVDEDEVGTAEAAADKWVGEATDWGSRRRIHQQWWDTKFPQRSIKQEAPKLGKGKKILKATKTQTKAEDRGD